MTLTPNSEEEKKYLQNLIKKHTGQRVVYTTKCTNRRKQNNNEDYESIVKEIDEMLAIREIDKFLDERERKKNTEKEEMKVEPEKSKVLSCQIVICENTKEEIFELPEKPKREIFELYAKPRTEKYKRKNGIDWKKELDLA